MATMLAATPAAALEHKGPFGLKWGKGPADARAILASKVTFVDEKPAPEAPYHTIDQRYGGSFGRMPTAEIVLRFYKGEFFYMSVTLATAEARAASKVWDQAVRRMTRVYGKPLRISEAPRLASGKAILDNVPLGEKRDAVLPLLWNERLEQDELALHKLKDLQIRTDLWDPFAGWKFTNHVTVQLFIGFDTYEGGAKGPLKPLWIFVKDDVYKLWRAEVRESTLTEPRDF